MATRRHPRCLTGDAFHRPPTGLGGDAFADVISGIVALWRHTSADGRRRPERGLVRQPLDHSMGP